MKKADTALSNELLSYERERRHWTQEAVAERIGAPDSKMVGRWERGITLPTTQYRDQLAMLFGKNARELGFARKGEIPFWNVPYRQNMFFTGRENLLAQVHSTLISQKRATLIPPLAFSGLGGVGKTQTALEYAHRYAHEYHTIAWIRANSAEVLASDFAALTALLNLPEQQEQDEHVMIQAVKDWLAAMTRWLLIFDNADDLHLLNDFLPSPARGHILMTTRTRMSATMAQALEIEAMLPEEGASFLLRRAKIIAHDVLPSDAAEADYKQAMAISDILGGLPLALDQAGAYIEETGCSLSNYLDLYQQHRAEFLHWRGDLVSGHPEPVATTWSLSFNKIARSNHAATELLNFLAFLAPDGIPEELIAQGAPELGSLLAPVAADPLKLNRAFKELRKFSLIRRHPETNMLSIHRLVQAVLLEQMDNETQRQWAEIAVRALNRAFPDGSFGTWQLCSRLLPQAHACIALIEQWHLAFPEAAHLLLHLASYLKQRGQLEQVEQLLQQAAGIFKETLGSEHLELAQCLYELAAFYLTKGNYAQAEALHRHVLQIREQQLGTDHTDVAQSLHELGIIFYGLADYTQAEACIQRCVQIFQALHPVHPNLAEAMNDLAVVYRKQGKNAQAEPMLLQALQLHVSQFGEEHPNTGGHLHNLAACYLEMGRYAEAESYYQRALAAWEKMQGADHFDYAYGLNGLANLYTAQGKYAQAEPLYQRALTIFEASIGPESVRVARLLYDMASFHTAQGNYMQARSLYQRALTIFKASLEADHPDITKTLDNLDKLYAV